MNQPESSYDFFSPNKIVFGWGRLREAGSLVSEYGRRAILVSGSRTLQKVGVVNRLIQTLEDSKISIAAQFQIPTEPTTAQIDGFVKQLAAVDSNFNDAVFVALGGGAAIDTAKALSAMAVNAKGKSIVDFLEGVGTGAAITATPLPIIAIPTTAGTGAEATKNAVVSVERPAVKKSVRHPGLMPKVALVDPELTTYCPVSVTSSSGIDALTQLIESFISKKAQPIPQALAIQGLGLIWRSLETAVADGENQSAREKVAHAALLSGMCLANSGLGMAHGVAAALGAHAHVSHGVACACMLPIALETNKQSALSELSALANFLLPPSRNYGLARIDEFIDQIKNICQNLHMPTRLKDLGVKKELLPLIARDSQGNSMNGNPKTLTQTELIDILEKNW